MLAFLMLTGVLSTAGADSPHDYVALETAPVSKTAPLLLDFINKAPKPELSASQQLGSELSKMFQEGATKLDPPRPKVSQDEVVAGGGVPTGGRSISVMAYSYCLTGRTASGRYTAPGIVAVDTRVIPMGSKLYIPGYGWGVAADTGGAIVGNKIDVWFPSLGQCYQWGVRPVTIKVFPK
jgi:3D (Asp-Asp-Asp) domain-containing protein